MADNITAPRGVLVWLVGGPGAAGVGLTAVIAGQLDPEVLRAYRLVVFPHAAPAPARSGARNYSRRSTSWLRPAPHQRGARMRPIPRR
jgi:hypothetical protein